MKKHTPDHLLERLEGAAALLEESGLNGSAMGQRRDNQIVAELMNALNAFVDYYPCGVNPYLDNACTNARAALAKARGEDQ